MIFNWQTMPKKKKTDRSEWQQLSEAEWIENWVYYHFKWFGLSAQCCYFVLFLPAMFDEADSMIGVWYFSSIQPFLHSKTHSLWLYHLTLYSTFILWLPNQSVNGICEIKHTFGQILMVSFYKIINSFGNKQVCSLTFSKTIPHCSKDQYSISHYQNRYRFKRITFLNKHICF